MCWYFRCSCNSCSLIAYVVNTENNKYEGTYSLNVDTTSVYGLVDDTAFADPTDAGAGFDTAGQSSTMVGAGYVNTLVVNNLSGRSNLFFSVSNETGDRVIVQGVQLVSVPEPSMLGFLFLGAMVLLRHRLFRHYY